MIRYAIWYQSLFSTFLPFLSVCMTQYDVQTRLSNFKVQNANQTDSDQTSSNLTTFECCFLISQYHENCNAMSSFTVICHVHRSTFIYKAAQSINVFISLLQFLIIVYYIFVVVQQIMKTVSLLKFHQNVQFSSVIFKKAF